MRISATLRMFSPVANRGSSLMACRRIWTKTHTHKEGCYDGIRRTVNPYSQEWKLHINQGIHRTRNFNLGELKRTPVSFNTHRHVLIFTKIKLSIDGCVGQFGKAAEELGNELCCQTLLLRATLHAIQDDLVGILVLQNKKKKKSTSINICKIYINSRIIL